ncbi:hypothetical protein L6452_12855 [Arctium lappa]|uniref:Uncharacterized protein n=1 Tax=Arctium lappa TaxID=4217 RepID=A0ACB9CGJ1_ARCLA|nr:hypothetical protein L6452_12855 [Arctium lappa]
MRDMKQGQLKMGDTTSLWIVQMTWFLMMRGPLLLEIGLSNSHFGMMQKIFNIGRLTLKKKSFHRTMRKNGGR